MSELWGPASYIEAMVGRCYQPGQALISFVFMRILIQAKPASIGEGLHT